MPARVLDFGDPAALHVARRVLEAEQVAVLPTEALYGFSAIADSEPARLRILELKRIERGRPFVGLVPTLEVLESYVDTDRCAAALRFLAEVGPAPLTAVLPVGRALPWGEPLESGGSAAFRIPGHPRLRELVASLGHVVLSTSVNRTGAPPFRDIASIATEFGADDVWLFRDARLEREAARNRPALASTLVDCTTWPPRVLRAGAYDVHQALDRHGVGHGT